MVVGVIDIIGDVIGTLILAGTIWFFFPMLKHIFKNIRETYKD